MTERVDLQATASAVAIVTDDQKGADSIARAIDRNLFYKGDVNIVILRDFKNLEMKGDYPLAMLVDLTNIKRNKQFPHEFAATLHEIQAKNPLREFIFIGYCVDMSTERAVALYSAGFDAILSFEPIDQLVLNTLSLLRRFNAKASGFQTNLARLRREEMNIEGWRFHRNKSTHTPDGTLVKLTDAELSYIKKLYFLAKGKDGLGFADEINKDINEDIRQNAIVYKIKKKLGSNFPIFSKGAGRYFLKIEAGD